MKDIELNNRYGDKNYLQYIAPNKYKLVLNSEVKDYCRYVYADGCSFGDNEYYAVDPSGGPFLSIGSRINENETITRIYCEKDSENKDICYILTCCD